MISKSFVTHHFLEEHDIHEFIFSKTSRAAVDEYFDFIPEIYDQHLKGRKKAFIILDIHESSMLPVKYASDRMAQLFQELNPFPRTFVAYLSDDFATRSLLGTLDYTASRNVDRLSFAFHERQQAIEWLLTRNNPDNP